MSRVVFNQNRRRDKQLRIQNQIGAQPSNKLKGQLAPEEQHDHQEPEGGDRLNEAQEPGRLKVKLQHQELPGSLDESLREGEHEVGQSIEF